MNLPAWTKGGIIGAVIGIILQMLLIICAMRIGEGGMICVLFSLPTVFSDYTFLRHLVQPLLLTGLGMIIGALWSRGTEKRTKIIFLSLGLVLLLAYLSTDNLLFSLFGVIAIIMAIILWIKK